MSLMDNGKDWLITSPKFRRFLIITGWLTMIGIPVFIVAVKYATTPSYAAIYSILATVVGSATGLYMWNRGQQDKTITNDIAGKLADMVIKNMGNDGGGPGDMPPPPGG